MDLGLEGRVAVVAGASSGIGKAIARSLALEGAEVAILSRSKSNLERACAEIKKHSNVEVYPFVCDVTQPKQIDATFIKIEKKLGEPQIVVCNAGGPPSKHVADITEKEWDDAYRLSLKSTIMLAQAALPAMQLRKWGRIIAITSISAVQPDAGLTLSSTMRPGVHGLIKSISNDYGQFGITANVICPGYTTTERLNELAEAISKRTGKTPKKVYSSWKAEIPAKRLAKPEELGDLAAFLASERAGYINGAAINIDGGFIRVI
jgi:3-oxoacyl-[acyl-carrier protein] reductase